MPHLIGYASSFEDLLGQLTAWATDSAIHGQDAWELMRSDPWPRGTILKAHGWEENEHFYVGLMPTAIQKGVSYKNWFYDPKVMLSEFVWHKKGLGLTMGLDNEIICANGEVKINT